jgi:PAS domain S-box-containing protein
MHELLVHQIELESQNETLRQTMADLEESRNRYAELYEFAPAGYLTINECGKITEANLTASTLLGIERNKLRNRRFDHFVAVTERKHWQQLFQCVKNGAAGQTLDVLLQRGDASEILVQLDCRRDESKVGPPRLRMAITDISERKQIEQQFREAKDEAEKANNAKSRFLAAASHDLRQPLSALSIYASILKSTAPPAGQQLVAKMQDCICGLSELLTDLLDLSKLEAGVVTPSIDGFPIADVFANLASVHAPEAELKGIRLRFVPSDLTAHTDMVLFRRSLGNLIENSVRYTERGSVLIACRRRLGKIWVEVRDSGIGIAADKTMEAFEEFRQLGDEARTSGSGLGLAIAAKTAALLGLEISVHSWPGRGSVFAIELPLCQSRPAVPAAAKDAVVSQSLRIALVEDNYMVREALIAGLEMLGHQVVAAASKAELLDKLDTLPPNVVVSDYRLAEGETGFDVITAVRGRFGSTLPALLITGDTAPGLLRSMTDRGIIVLHKPVALADLQPFLEKLTCPPT